MKEQDWRKDFKAFIESSIVKWENQGRPEEAKWGVRNFWTGFAPKEFEDFIAEVKNDTRADERKRAMDEIGAAARLALIRELEEEIKKLPVHVKWADKDFALTDQIDLADTLILLRAKINQNV